MALRKLDRSYQTPRGCRLATVEEARDNLEWIKQSNLLEEWDRARLLNGWIGGSAYDLKVEEAFTSCLGYMLVIESPTPEIFNTDDRNALLYYEVPGLSKEGRSVAVLLCCEDWNKDVLHWLMGRETEEVRARENAIWEGNGMKAASKLASAIAREWQGFHAKVRVAKTELSLASWEALRKCFRGVLQAWVVGSQESLKALKIEIQESDEGEIANDISEDFLGKIHENVDEHLNQWESDFKEFGFDTSVTSTWEAVADTIWYLLVETISLLSIFGLCDDLYEEAVMYSEAKDDCPTLASLIYHAYNCFKNYGCKLIEEAAKEANGDCKRFAEVLCDQFSSIFNCKGKYDALNTCFVRAAKKGDLNTLKRLTANGVKPSKTFYKGKTSLHYAAELDDKSKGLEIAQIFLAATEESLLNNVDSENRSPLHAAVDEGHAEMCKLLLQNKASVTSKDEDGWTPLHYAFYRDQQNEEVFRLLISADGEDSIEASLPLVDIKDNQGETPLDFALKNNAPVNMVAWLLSLSIQAESYFKKLELPLYLRESSRIGFVDLVEKLVDGGADPF